MSKNQHKLPQIRFPEFDGYWEEYSLGDTSEIVTGSTPETKNKHYYGGEKLFISPGDMNVGRYVSTTSTKLTEQGFAKGRRIKPGSVLVVCIGSSIGKVAQTKLESVTNQQINAVIGTSGFDSNFIFSLLEKNSQRIKSLAGEQAVPILNKSNFSKIKLNFPLLSEQQKIGFFLKAIDGKIELLTKKKTLLEQYKKGVMQQIFSQQIRFKDDNGEEYPDWEEKTLNTLLYETKERNSKIAYDKKDVLSVSGEYGIVNQVEFMGRSYAGESVHNYHVVKTGDIVYTKSPLKANPYGIIKVNKGVAGIVSTLYAVYGCYENASGDYLDYYFELDDNTNSYLRPLVHKGAKNDMKINNAHVLSGAIIVPSKAEQLKIVDFLDSINKRIRVISQQLEFTKTYKKGLLQRLFV